MLIKMLIKMKLWLKNHNPLEFLSNFFRYVLRDKDNVYIIFSLFVLAAGVIFYFQSGKMAEESLSEQMLHREQVVARAGAKETEIFLRDAGRALELLSRKLAVIQMGPDTQGALERFVSDWRDTPIVGVVVIDKDGKAIFNANRIGAPFEKGTPFADRDYFAWAKGAKEGEVFWGKAVISKVGQSKGQYIIPAATPIFENGEFKGVLTTPILIPELTKTYIDALKISDNTQVYLINTKGDFLVSYYPELVGLNMLDYVKDHPFPGSSVVISVIEERLGTMFEGKADLVWPDLKRGNKLTRFLLAYSPVNIGDKGWSLVVATPYDDAMVFSGPFNRDQFLILVFFLLTVLGYAIIGITLTKRSVKEAYLKGYKDGVEHKLHE